MMLHKNEKGLLSHKWSKLRLKIIMKHWTEKIYYNFEKHILYNC